MHRQKVFGIALVLACALASRSVEAAVIPSPSNDLLLSANGGIADINGDPTDGGQNYGGLPPANLNDGDRNGIYNNGQGVDGSGSLAHTAGQAAEQYMEVKLPSPKQIDSVNLFNRTDCCDSRINTFELQIFNGATKVYDNNGAGSGITFVSNISTPAGSSGMAFNFATVTGDLVKVIQHNGDYMNLAELEAFKPTPEPASIALFGLGALGLFAVARRRRAA